MRILFLTHRLPCPPDRGCTVRAAAILHRLAARHDVWCAGFLDAAGPPEARREAGRSLDSLRHICRDVAAEPFHPTRAGCRGLAGMLSGGTATEGYFRSGRLARAVREWSRDCRFDAVFAFSSGMAPLALEAAAPVRVLCMDDLDSRKWQDLARAARWPARILYGTEARRLARREWQWLSSFDTTLMVSRREADLVTDPELRRKVRVIPPILPDLPGSSRDLAPASQAGPVVGFVGAMDYPPNIDAACWLAAEIWPRVRRHCPTARLMIVGRSPSRAVRDLARIDGITVTGGVPAIHDHLEQMRLCVAPLRVSRGVQIKVLSAMSAGRPCVVTSTVADGLGARAPRDLVIADSPSVFAAAVIDLLEDPARAELIGRAGRRFLEGLDPDKTMARLETLLAGREETEADAAIDPGSLPVVKKPIDRVLVLR
jgi:sugar transferase (PEP-CTERM/EpsH1 system associated)